WMHPSYRDLVIEELSRDQASYERFMSQMSLAGVKLAVSDTGGFLGDRRLPLMRSEKSWTLLESRCVEIASQGDRSDQHELLTSLFEAHKTATKDMDRAALGRIVGRCLRAIKPVWDSQALDSQELRAFARASAVADVLEPAL